MNASTQKSFISLTEYIESLKIDEKTRCNLLMKLRSVLKQGLDIMVTGATGCGKSSTINAIFRADKARVGESASPETQTIDRYDYDGMTIWDTPGLGDGKEADKRHTDAIISKLKEQKSDGTYRIDAVLVILDAGSRDLGTSFTLINEVIVPNMPDPNRVLVAINQADMALKGRHWNHEANQPDEVLLGRLEEMSSVVQSRIKASTGLDMEPVVYCAGYKENGVQLEPYNLAKLLSRLLSRIPAKKRLAIVDNVNRDAGRYKSNDGKADYGKEIVSSFREACRSIGESVGEFLLGKTGASIGRAVGDVVGSVGDWIASWF